MSAGGGWTVATRRALAGAPHTLQETQAPPRAFATLDGLTRHTRTAAAFGAPTSFIVLHEDAATAVRAADSALAELQQVEQVMSLYRPESDLCRLNREGFIDRPHPFLVEVLRMALVMSRQSDGAFDVTVQPLWDLYAAAKKSGRLPEPAEVDATRRKVNWRNIEMASDAIRFRQPETAVTLNALAQGYAADRVLLKLREHGIHHALVNTGEIGARGHKEDGEPWQVGLQHPRQPDAYSALVKLTNRCMATSGDYATRFSDDFLRHHIFDPATGRSPEELSSATIVAPSGLEADGLSTSVLVLGAERGLQLLPSFPGAEAFLVFKNGRTRMTPHFPLA